MTDENKTEKPDFRILVTTKSDNDFGTRTLTVKAAIVYINEKGEVRGPHFEYQADGIGEFDGLTISGQISSWQGKVDAADFYGRDLSFMETYRISLPRAEAMVKVLRRTEQRLRKADDKFGSTDFAGLCARFADAIGAKDRYPLGIYERGQCFPTTGTEYRWMDTDSLRRYLANKVEDWMTEHSLEKKVS